MNYDDEGFERPGKQGMSYDHWKSTEPDDSDIEYCDNWQEAEARAKRMAERVRRERRERDESTTSN